MAEKAFLFTPEPDIYLNKDTGMRDDDIGDNQTTQTCSPEHTDAGLRKTPGGRSYTKTDQEDR